MTTISRKTKIFGSFGLFFSSLAGTAYCYRPIPDFNPPPIHEVIENDKKYHDYPEPLILIFFRSVSIFGGCLMSRALAVFNKVEIINHDKWLKYAYNRKPEQALITVSNHASTLDDPFMYTWMLPISKWHANGIRWSICSQEICFKDSFSSSFGGLFKALPVARGHGVKQHAMTVLGHKVANGDWVHIFPQGRIWQDEKVHNLKWGVGRLVSYAAVPPLLVPYYFKGMADLMPLDPATDQIKSIFPTAGNNIRLIVGDPIDVSDLLQTYKIEKELESEDLILNDPQGVSPAERKLYKAVTHRVKDALNYLEENFEALAKKDS